MTTPPSWSAASCEHRSRIDELLAEYSEGWTLDRMPAVDRNVLRLGVFELMWADDVPDAVAVTEAIALVRDLSTDESPGFVNGILGNILRSKPSLAWLSLSDEIGRRADQSDWVDHGVRAGLVAYGVVHLLVGWLALQLALGDRSGTVSSKGALHQLAGEPLGRR